MSETPEAPAPAATVPAATSRLLRFDSSQELRVATAIGVAMLSAAVFLSVQHSRPHGNLDLSNFTVGVLASVAMVGLGGLVLVLLPEVDAGSNLASWPGAAGVVGCGAMTSVLITDYKASEYTTAAVLVGLSVVGYLLTRTAPFVLSGLFGVLVFYVRAFSDIFFDHGTDAGSLGNNAFMIEGAGVVVFVIAMTVVGWLLPATRVLTGVIIGAGGVVVLGVFLQLTMALRALTAFSRGFGSSDGSFSSTHFTLVVSHNPYTNDIYAILAYSAVLVAFWAGCAMLTGHVGFRILIVAILVLCVPMAASALSTRHPTWWEVVLAFLGGVVLLFASYLAWKRRASATSA